MADFYVWEEATLGLDLKAMDDEHKELISRMNKLHAAYSAKGDRTTLEKLLNELAEYTVKHFTDEEAYMAKVNFDGLETHKIIHQRLLNKFTEFATAFKASGQLTDDFFRFLSNWLTTHIRGIDMKYSPTKASKTGLGSL
jgi:hemerythrin-like metal-binding protein